MKPAPFDYRAPDSLEEALAVLAEHGEGQGAVVARIDTEVVERVRQGLPSLKHRVL